MAKQLKTVSGHDCRNKCVYSFWWNDVSDGADWTSTGRLQSPRSAAANERSPKVTSHNARTSRRLEVDERSRRRRLSGRSATYCSWPDKYWGAVTWRARYTMTASLNLMSQSQWKLARASAVCFSRLRPAIDWAATLMTVWRRLCREARRPASIVLLLSSRDSTSDWHTDASPLMANYPWEGRE